MKKRTDGINNFAIVCLVFVTLLLLVGLILTWTMDGPNGNDFQDGMQFRTSQIGISVIIIWLMILFPFLAWAVYYYNINEGKTLAEWDDIKLDKQVKLSLGVEASGPSEERTTKNPYKDETFGLPKGTIRAILAITLMIGTLALFIVAIGQRDILVNNQFFHENFEFFKTAFLMMIAFYFGSKSLEYLKDRWQTDKGSPSGSGSSSPPPPPGSGNFGDGDSGNSPSPSSPDLSNSSTLDPSGLKNKLMESFEEEDDDETPDDSEIKDEINNLLIPKEDEKEKQKELSEQDITKEADRLGIDVAAVKAVVAVESNGKGFLPDGRPKILFEGHIFYNQLKQINKREKKTVYDLEKLISTHPDIIYPKWTKVHYIGKAGEYSRFEKAALIHEDSAKMATSWGMFQIMGFNYKHCGFKSVNDFVDSMEESEHTQLIAFGKFLQDRKLDIPLELHDWEAFAKGYNGPAYAVNKYDEKLEQKFNEFSKQFNEDMSMQVSRSSSSEKQTLGEMYIKEGDAEIFRCKTLELPWRDNKRNVSSIPPGTYTVKKRWTEKHKNHFHILNVAGRSSILIHSGNFFNHTLGCILVGNEHADINKDGLADVTYSKATMDKLSEIMPDRFEITIS